MTAVVHWTAFDDGEPACGVAFPEPLSRSPLICGPDYPRVTTAPREVTCEGCQVYCRRCIPVLPLVLLTPVCSSFDAATLAVHRLLLLHVLRCRVEALG